MKKAHTFLLGILGGQVGLLLFFGIFEFEKIIVALYGGMWIGIGLAVFVLKHAERYWYTEVLGGVFGVQAVAFIVLEMAKVGEGLVEKAGFLAIGVWIGILIGILLNTLNAMEDRLAALESSVAKSDDDQA